MKKLTQTKLKTAIYDTIGLYILAIWMLFIYLIYPSVVDAFPPEDFVFYIVEHMYILLVAIGSAGNPIGWILALNGVRDPRIFATIGLGVMWFVTFWFTWRELR